MSGDHSLIMRRDLGTGLIMIHCIVLSIHHIVVKRVLKVASFLDAIESLHIGFVLAKQQRGRCVAIAIIFTQMKLLKLDHVIGGLCGARFGVVVAP